MAKLKLRSDAVYFPGVCAGQVGPVPCESGGDLLQLRYRRLGDLHLRGRLADVVLVGLQRGQLRVEAQRYGCAAAKAGIGLRDQAGTCLLSQRIELLMHVVGVGDQGIQEAVPGSDGSGTTAHWMTCSS